MNVNVKQNILWQSENYRKRFFSPVGVSTSYSVYCVNS